jgi:hypothetical protein
VTWWNGTQEITNTQHWKMEHENGTGSAKAEVSLRPGRADIGRTFTCSVNSSAMTVPAKSSVVVDMNLAPDRLQMIPPTTTQGGSAFAIMSVKKYHSRDGSELP